MYSTEYLYSTPSLRSTPETLLLGRPKKDGSGKIVDECNRHSRRSDRTHFSFIMAISVIAPVAVTRLSEHARWKGWDVLSSHTSRCLARVDPDQHWHGGTVFSAMGGGGQTAPALCDSPRDKNRRKKRWYADNTACLLLMVSVMAFLSL